MKLTAAPGEHCWRSYYLVSPEIWIDGVQLHSVSEADDVEGYTIQVGVKADGDIDFDDDFVTRRREGKVAFVGGQRRPA